MYYYMPSMPLCMLMNLFMYVTYGIMCNCFGFQACRLPTKHMVAYPPPSIFPLSQGMKVATIDLRKVTCCLWYALFKWDYED